MNKLDEKQLELLEDDVLFVLSRFEQSYEKMLRKERYNNLAGKIADLTDYSVRMSMIEYRVKNNIEQSRKYLSQAQRAVLILKDLEKLFISKCETEPEAKIRPTALEGTIFLSLANKKVNDLSIINSIFCGSVYSNHGLYDFAQQYTPLLLLGALDKRAEFESAYQIFKDIKKSYFEEGLSLYIDMLSAIVSRDQALFDGIHLQAEAAMKSHATDKKWGNDFLTGGHEYNAIAYDFRGTALCCLAKVRGMQVNHFSCYYPKEIIEHIPE